MSTDKQNEGAKGASKELLISGNVARIIIRNSHALLRHKMRGSPLWSMVGQITGHGSGYSWEICVSANIHPGQDCGVKHLAEWDRPATDLPAASVNL